MANNTEWEPEPLDLRKGEHTDISGHARRNIEQLKLAEEELDRDLSAEIEEILDEEGSR